MLPEEILDVSALVFAKNMPGVFNSSRALLNRIRVVELEVPPILPSTVFSHASAWLLLGGMLAKHD